MRPHLSDAQIRDYMFLVDRTLMMTKHKFFSALEMDEVRAALIEELWRANCGWDPSRSSFGARAQYKLRWRVATELKKIRQLRKKEEYRWPVSLERVLAVEQRGGRIEADLSTDGTEETFDDKDFVEYILQFTTPRRAEVLMANMRLGCVLAGRELGVSNTSIVNTSKQALADLRNAPLVDPRG